MVDPLHKPLLVDIMQLLEEFHGNKVLLVSTWGKRTQNIEADCSFEDSPGPAWNLAGKRGYHATTEHLVGEHSPDNGYLIVGVEQDCDDS